MSFSRFLDSSIFLTWSLHVCFTMTDFTGMEPYIFAAIKCFMMFGFVLFIVMSSGSVISS